MPRRAIGFLVVFSLGAKVQPLGTLRNDCAGRLYWLAYGKPLQTMATILRKLPRDEFGKFRPTFQTKAHTYRIISPEEGIGILRWSLLSKMSAVLGYGADVKTQLDNLRKARQIVNDVLKGKGDILELGVHLQAVEDGIRKENEMRYHFSFYTAALFIVREGEDLTKYSDEMATDKIDDWNDAGYDATDFFLLVLNVAPNFLNPLRDFIATGKATPAGRSSESGG